MMLAKSPITRGLGVAHPQQSHETASRVWGAGGEAPLQKKPTSTKPFPTAQSSKKNKKT